MIYLDNASTTKPCEAVKNEIFNIIESFGNPSSMHKLGIDAENIIKNSKKECATLLGVTPDNIYFTSGGTESNNTAILGYCHQNKRKGNHIITTKVEHPSVLSPFKILEDEGFSVTYLGTDKYGVISLEELENAVCEDTILVSCMHANNETGAIMPVDKLKGVVSKKAKNCAIHIDSVQGFGKLPIKPSQWGIDMLSASGHKIHGIKGTGLLYLSDKVKIMPLINGGGQQKNMRSGTENVIGIGAMGKAVSEIKKVDFDKIKELRELLKTEILTNIENVKINESKPDTQAGYILNVSFLGIKSEILLHSLEMHEIYVSTGSACSTHKPMPSHVLQAMGCTDKEIMGAVRFSLSSEITKEDIIKTVEALKKEVATIRKYMR